MLTKLGHRGRLKSLCPSRENTIGAAACPPSPSPVSGGPLCFSHAPSHGEKTARSSQNGPAAREISTFVPTALFQAANPLENRAANPINSCHSQTKTGQPGRGGAGGVGAGRCRWEGTGLPPWLRRATQSTRHTGSSSTSCWRLRWEPGGTPPDGLAWAGGRGGSAHRAAAQQSDLRGRDYGKHRGQLGPLRRGLGGHRAPVLQAVTTRPVRQGMASVLGHGTSNAQTGQAGHPSPARGREQRFDL